MSHLDKNKILFQNQHGETGLISTGKDTLTNSSLHAMRLEQTPDKEIIFQMRPYKSDDLL